MKGSKRNTLLSSGTCLVNVDIDQLKDKKVYGPALPMASVPTFALNNLSKESTNSKEIMRKETRLMIELSFNKLPLWPYRAIIRTWGRFGASAIHILPCTYPTKRNFSPYHYPTPTPRPKRETIFPNPSSVLASKRAEYRGQNRHHKIVSVFDLTDENRWYSRYSKSRVSRDQFAFLDDCYVCEEGCCCLALWR